VKASRERLYDILALLTVVIIIALDQWTKALVVQYLSPPDSGRLVPIIGDYLTLNYIQNSGAAFGMFANTMVLAVLIAVAIIVIASLYLRILNTGPLALKLIFGMIIGGAAGNLIDRIHHGGYVVDFIFFQIPQIGFHFAVFNLADASISVGVFLLFVYVLFSGFKRTEQTAGGYETRDQSVSEGKGDKAIKQTTPRNSGVIRSTEQDA
jgi:signal peptidase II